MGNTSCRDVSGPRQPRAQRRQQASQCGQVSVVLAPTVPPCTSSLCARRPGATASPARRMVPIRAEGRAQHYAPRWIPLRPAGRAGRACQFATGSRGRGPPRGRVAGPALWRRVVETPGTRMRKRVLDWVEGGRPARIWPDRRSVTQAAPAIDSMAGPGRWIDPPDSEGITLGASCTVYELHYYTSISCSECMDPGEIA